MNLVNGASARDLPRWIAYVLPLGATLLLFAPALPYLGTQYLGDEHTDMAGYYRHAISFALASIHSGELPLWNPYTFCGAPFLLNTSAGLLYPPCALAYCVWPLPLAINLVLIIHVALFGSFTAFFARVRGVSCWAGALAGCCASLSSVLTSHVYAGHFTMVFSYAWLPLLFGIQQLLLRKGFRYFPSFVLVAAMTFLSGHPQISYYAGLFLALSLILHATRNHERRRWTMQQIAIHVLAGSAAAGLCAIDLLPLASVARNSMRNALPDAGFLRLFALPIENVITLAAPGFLGLSQEEYIGRWASWELVHYAGLITLVMGSARALTDVANRRMPDLGLMFAFSVGLAVAGYIPGVNQAVACIPGWTMFRCHSRIVGVGLIFLIVLAAQGFDDLRSGTRATHKIVFACFLQIALFALLLLPWIGPEYHRILTSPAWHRERLGTPLDDATTFRLAVGNAGQALVVCAATALLGLATLGVWRLSRRCFAPFLLAITCCELLMASSRWATASFAVPEVAPLPIGVLQFIHGQHGVARCDLYSEGFQTRALTQRIEAFSGADNMVTRYMNSFVTAYEASASHRDIQVARHHVVELRADDPLLDLANLGFILSPASADLRTDLLALQMEEAGMRLWRRPNPMPRAYVVRQAQFVQEDEIAIQEALLNGEFHKEVLIAGYQGRTPSQATATSAVPAEVEYRGLHEVKVKVPASGWLVLTDSYFPNWRATIGNRTVPVYRANSAFRGVQVQAGDEVVFRYRSPALLAGASISAATAALLAFAYGLLAWNRRAARRSTSS